ncbi:hypothetical protein PAMP_021920 [Pampus punctatissimus]
MILNDVGEIGPTTLRSDDLTSVTRLRIADAGVTGVAERALSSFQNLVSLHLEQNLLTEINPNWLSRPSVLRELNLTENQIQVLNESMLVGFSGLSKLSLNKNRITTIDPNCFRFQTNLAELDLSDNRMTRVSPRVFGSLGSTRMRLDGNPWNCSCEAGDFVDFLKVLLCALLFAACVLAVLYRRKHNSKAVMPRNQKEEKNEVKEDGRLSHAAPGVFEKRNFTGNKHTFTGVRAKSANALLVTSPSCVSGKDQVTLQSEIKDEGKAGSEENIADMKTNEKQARDEDTRCVSVNTETLYLSIGINQNKPSQQSADSQGQRSRTGKRLSRISTWPPTAVQWQERCNMKEGEEETADESFKFPGEGKKVEDPSISDKQGVKAEPTEEVNPVLSKVSMPVNDCCAHFREALNHSDLRQEDSDTQQQTNEPRKLNPAQKSRQKAGNRSTSSKAPSGGASPDDETLLYGNQYAFMDLLHEVVQNNGRWTRERWKQVSKQRHNQQGR